jgi:hypothetical protein
MKATSELLREHGRSDKPTERRAAIQRWLQLDHARLLAVALRNAGAEVAPYSWSYDDE